jgi:hypothetical protein
MTIHNIVLLYSPVKRGIGGKQSFDRLERAIRRLGIEEVDDRNPQQVQACKEEIGAVLQLLKHNRVNQHGPAYADSPARNAEPVTLRTYIARPNLGKDQKGHGTPRRGVRQVEQEQYSNVGGRKLARPRRVMARGFVHGRGDKVDDKKTKRAAYQALPTAEAVDDLGRDDGAEDARGRETAGQAVLGERRVARGREENGRVGGYGRDAGPRGHNLQPDVEPGAAAEVLAGGARKAAEDLGKL